ncbi:zinc finger and BTB domain-containing protein 40-like [Epinephelus moara]|uniref:zinc finger and BTB domain-containing protein 40-like n=1 Tax=Epinephelus moara TaxID=300413 RepID=UPI00214F4815|nr:zinc finger and BTB domain-containing protein 40-like [Epinephelus moara]
MSSLECLREFVNDRLTAALEEIFGVFEKTIVEYEEEINRQRRLLDMVWNPEVKLHRIELPQQHVCKQEEVLTDQERTSSLDQENPEPPQIKEEEEELCTSQEGEQLELKEEADTFMLTPTHEESDHGEDQTLDCSTVETQSVVMEKPQSYISVLSSVVPEPTFDHQLLCHDSHVAESQDQTRGKHEDSGSTRDAEPEPQNHHHTSISHCINVYTPTMTTTHCTSQTVKNSFKCDTCEKAFRYKSLLQRHLIIHTGEKPHSCDTCGKRFSRTSILNAHMRTHTGQKPYSCNTCGKRFSQTSTLSAHIRIHTGEKPYSCNTCGKRFSRTSLLNSHSTVHTGKKPHTCNTCGKRFSRPSLLNAHATVHTGEKPYSCNTCGKRFSRTKQLNAHLRVHTGEKPYSCKTCGKRFSWTSQLKNHRKVHVGENPCDNILSTLHGSAPGYTAEMLLPCEPGRSLRSSGRALLAVLQSWLKTKVEYLREFVNERLTAAAEEIFGVFKTTIVEYEEEINRQRRLLENVWKPKTKLNNTVPPEPTQQRACMVEEALADQQLCIQERSTRAAAFEGRISQIKGSLEDFLVASFTSCSRPNLLALLLPSTQLVPTTLHLLSMILRLRACLLSDPGSQLHSDNSTMSSVEYLREFVKDRLTVAAEEIFRVFEESIVKYEEEISRQRRLLDIVAKPEVKLLGAELPQQHVCKQEEVLADQQLCIQERTSSLDQEDPEPPQIKEEEEELCISQEGEQLELKEEADTFILTPTHEESDLGEDQTLDSNPDETLSAEEKECVANMPVINSVVSEAHSDHQVLSHNSHVAESKEQKEGKHGDSGLAKDAETKLKRRCHKIRSHSNDVSNSNLSEIDRNTHTPKRSSECDKCGKDFKYKSQLQKHMRTHTGEKPYSCKTCGKDFTCSSVLSVHMRTHTGERPYLCTTCGKRFRGKSVLNNHMRTHTGEKPYTCNTCGKIFRQTSSLNIHLRTHTGEKPYSCKTCGKAFKCSSNLNVHMRTHTGVKPYVCKTCDRGFCDISGLIRHMTIHTGEKPHTCKTCGRGFTASRDLTIHIRRDHTGEKLYVCETCGEGCFDASNLADHMRTHTGK